MNRSLARVFGSVSLVLLGVSMLCIITTACTPVETMVLERKLRDHTDHSYIDDMDSLRVTLCGTGTPQVDTERNQACTLVAAGGMIFLFDAGEGAAKSIARLNVPLDKLTRVFMTHWHSDHFNGLGPLVGHGWLAGRQEPMQVYGPVGVTRVAEGLNMIYQDDVAFRAAHFNAHPENAVMEPHEVSLPEGKNAVRVFEQNGVTIEAHRVDHHPVDPAFGYTVTYKGRKLFISGDTKVTELYIDAMQDADLVVHEALAGAMVASARRVAEGMGLKDVVATLSHVPNYHADTIELARLAQKARVKHLVLTHLIPAPDNFLMRTAFVAGMSDEFKGKLSIGDDGMDFRIGVVVH